MLYDQPSAVPSRKMGAVILAAFIVNGLIGMIRVFIPDIADAMPGEEWVAALAPIIAGYMTREKV